MVGFGMVACKISYYYPIIRKNELRDLGPKSFRVLDCWFKEIILNSLYNRYGIT